MKEILIDNRDVAFENPVQIINMGGPWIGDLVIDNRKVIGNILIDNFYFDASNHRFYFILYNHTVNKRFSICYLSTKDMSIHVYLDYFEIIFIKEIINNDELIFYNAFHDKDVSKRTNVILLKSKWHLLQNG